LRYLHASQIGLGAARDLAWREAKGEIVAFTDDDCYLAPDYIDALVETFAAHPEIGCLGGRILLFDPDDIAFTIDLRDRPEDTPPYRFLSAGSFHGANLAIRKSVLQRIGGLDPNLGAGTPFPCEDIDAVAASLWAGYPARFDPAVVVMHHHRRKTADIPRLVRDYDRGRGAYYAKYILRPDTRMAYLKGWFRASNSAYYRSTLTRFVNESRSAAVYFAARRRHELLLPLTLVTVAGCCVIATLLATRVIATRIGNLVAGR
jgi:GT2 family glycosyltransferase